MRENGHLEKLRELTQEVKKLDSFVLEVDQDVIEYDLEVGSSIGYGLFHIDDVAVQRNDMTKGTIFPEHKHEESEFMVVYRGKARYEFDGKEKIVTPGKFIYFIPNQPHACEALEDTSMIAITIPADKGYPNARERK